MATPPTLSASHQLLNFNIDHYLSPWIPSNRLDRLPAPISRFLGHRRTRAPEPPSVLQWPVAFLATVAALCIAGALNAHAPGLVALQPPVLIASLGASAVLDFNTIKSPLSQPRNAVVGNVLSAVTGVAMAKAFAPHEAAGAGAASDPDLTWLSAALACALASLAMSVTATVHPPGGATAVIACTDARALRMGWWLVALVALDSAVLVAVACLFNNVFRQYPTHWWVAGDVGARLRRQRRAAHGGVDVDVEQGEAGARDVAPEGAEVEGAEKGSETASQSESARASASLRGSGHDSDDESDARTLHREDSRAEGEKVDEVEEMEGVLGASVGDEGVTVPGNVRLSEEEVLVLARIRERARMGRMGL